MSSDSQAQQTSPSGQKIEIVKEIRFAVVLYGGVSLAIYINGVAQELLRMVRATALNADGTDFKYREEELDRTEPENGARDASGGVGAFYRDLAYLLASRDEELHRNYRQWLAGGRRGDNPLDALKRKKSPVVRFIVDILSGTSAGGINGIYMAKALAGGQGIEQLEELWQKEGDINKLLRNENSLLDDGRPLNLPALTQGSLLNDERMYFKLLDAFRTMDRAPDRSESFVDEVDLFITTTDYWGVPVPLQLVDNVIHERRHRNVFHLRFRENDEDFNDFAAPMTPFLAYAARCTSSFPLAFEPMTIEGARRIIESVGKNGDASIPQFDACQWRKFFRPVTIETPDEYVDWDRRIFVDGGYLDNKPFGYAIEALAQKQSNALVERKLIYVEPKPELDDSIARARATNAPGAIENTLAAVTAMPTYETIREDLQLLLKRNRLIVRVNQLLSNSVLDEVSSLAASLDQVDAIAAHSQELIEQRSGGAPADKAEWAGMTLGEIAKYQSQAASSYYRLRITALTDDLARMVTRRAGFDPDSDYFFAVRDLVRWWREKNFNPQKNERRTEMLFLKNYDYNYRLRRLRFVLQQADRLLQADENLKEELAATVEVAASVREKRLLEKLGETGRKALRERYPLLDPEIFELEKQSAGQFSSAVLLDHLTDDARREELAGVVRDLKTKINQILLDMRRQLRRVEPDAGDFPPAPFPYIHRKVADLNEAVKATARRIGVGGLNELLGRGPDKAGVGAREGYDLDSKARLERTGRLIDKPENKGLENDLQTIGEILLEIYDRDPVDSIFAVAREKAEQLFRRNDAAPLARAVHAYLARFYQNFDAFDQILFPVTYETPVGEGVVADVARISPLDATNLIDEQRERARGNGTGKLRRKVAGDIFFAFGSFFHEDWRANDILWGRLDAADRLVSILRPGDGQSRGALIDELQGRILRENYERPAAHPEGSLLRRAFRQAYGRDLAADEPDAALVEFMKKDYEINRDLSEKGILETTALSLKILSPVVRGDAKTIGDGEKFVAPVFSMLQSLIKTWTRLNVTAFFLLAGVFALGIWQIGRVLVNRSAAADWPLLLSWSILLLLGLAYGVLWFLLKSRIARAIVKNITGR